MSRPDHRRVAITGLGVVSAAGIGADAYFEGLCSPAPVGDRRVTGFDPNAHFESPKEARRADPYTQFLVAAADQALDQAGEIEADPTRCGTMIGTGVGGITTLEHQIGVLKEKGPRRVSPFLVPMMMANAGGATLAMRYGWMGPPRTWSPRARPAPTLWATRPASSPTAAATPCWREAPRRRSRPPRWPASPT